MIEQLYIPVIFGTTREQSKSYPAAQLIYDISKEFKNVRSEIIDPKNFVFKGDGNDLETKDSNYSKITMEADAFFIVTPEYNHSFPGSLKRMLDSELQNYLHKAVAFAGTSSGSWGGVRAIEALVMSVREMGLVSTFSDVQFPRVQDLFDSNSNLKDERYKERVRRAWVELLWMTEALSKARNSTSTLD